MRPDFRPWVVAILAVILLYLARQALSPFIVAAVFAYIFTPGIDSLAKRARLPRGAVVALSYVVFLLVLGFGVYAIERPLVRETRALSAQGTVIIDRLLTQALGGDQVALFGQEVTVADLSQSIQGAIQDSLGQPDQAIKLAEGVLHYVLATLFCLIATFYLLLDGRRFGAYLLRFVPPTRRDELVVVARRVHVILGHYLRGQLLLIALMSVITYFCLTLLFHLHYAIPIAIATGFLEVIPFLGPAIAATLAASVAFAQGGLGLVAGVLILYLVLRQLEDQLVMPQVVGRAVHLHPLVTILAVVIGEAIAGVLGMLLAVPITAAAKVVLDHVYSVEKPTGSERDTEGIEPADEAPSRRISATGTPESTAAD